MQTGPASVYPDSEKKISSQFDNSFCGPSSVYSIDNAKASETLTEIAQVESL